jgi:hypothetical protein
VCNVTVYIEGMENELEHFPQLIDDNGFDTYPKFASWCVPSERRDYWLIDRFDVCD